MKKALSLFTALIFVLLILTSCRAASLLDKNNPVMLTMWHVYGEQADSPMNRLIEEFNQTVGRDQGIIINVTVMTNTSQIGNQLLKAQSGVLGAPEMPDLFFCHNNNADDLGASNLINWNDVFSKEELDGYVEEFIEDGIVDDRLVVFPVSKSTHLLFINGTQFDRFCAETGVTYDHLSTWDGFFDVAAGFYTWSGGKPFCAFDYLLRAIELILEAEGETSYMTEDGWYDFDNPAVKEVWMKFAKALCQGHIVVSDLYSNTQVMTGEVIAGCGYSAAILYYNDTVTYPDNTTEPMNLQILPMPQIDPSNGLVTQAGVGLCSYKTTEQKAEAAAVFARWFTQSSRNLDFVTQTGYMPVSNGAFYAIDDHSFEKESYKRLYTTLKEVRDTCTMVKEPIYSGYYDRVQKLYDALRASQHKLLKRYISGENVEALAEETWRLFMNVE